MTIADGLQAHTLMISLSKGIEQPWDLNQGSNRNVDFCVWVLQVDGLQFHPFTHHASGNRILQKLGLDVQTWTTWVRNVVASQSNQLLWHIPDITARVERELEDLREFEHRTPISLRQEREKLKLYFRWQEQQYQEAKAIAESFSIKMLPDEIWQGNGRIRDSLKSLWLEYCQQRIDNAEGKADIFGDANPISSFYQDLQTQFFNQIPGLRIEHVGYPVPLFFPVPPMTVLVARARELPIERLKPLLFKSVEKLTSQNHDNPV